MAVNSQSAAHAKPSLPLVVVALGSNLGDSETILRQAALDLEELAAADFRLSSFYRTDPVDCPSGSPPFLNAVAAFSARPEETPESLLAKLLTLEKKFGRIPKKILNEPRPLDPDLIAFGREVRQAPDLILPHPRAHLRDFVLQPLWEVAPGHFLLK